MKSGYSKRSLVEKLGIKEGVKAIVLNSPFVYSDVVSPIPKGVTVETELRPSTFIHFFTANKEELQTMFPKLKESLAHNGMVWVSWPKKASNIPTNLNENEVMRVGLENGLVDVKVIAVNETWSGLKFVFRLKDRT